MLLDDIKNFKQLQAIEKHGIDISLFETPEELSKHLTYISKKKYYENNKERFKDYYEKNKEKISAKAKERHALKKQSVSEGRNPPVTEI
jgi:hypothetical protein